MFNIFNLFGGSKGKNTEDAILIVTDDTEVELVITDNGQLIIKDEE